MNRVLSWLYHHSAKFRDLKLGQINRKIEKFIGSSNQKQDIDLFMIKSDKLEELSLTILTTNRGKNITMPILYGIIL